MKVSITNVTGLRNKGVEALVVSLVSELQRRYEQSQVFLHTHDPRFDAQQIGANIQVVNSYLTRTPNHFALPNFNAIAYGLVRPIDYWVSHLSGTELQQFNLQTSDLVIASGGDIFTSDYGNLRKHMAPLSVAGCKPFKFLCGHTVGPFSKSDERYFKKTLNADLITVRDEESFAYLASLKLGVPTYRTADIAFLLPPSNFHLPETNSFVLSNAIAVSVSTGLARYAGLNMTDLQTCFTEFTKHMIEAKHNILLLPHVEERNPNNNDRLLCESIVAKLGNASLVRIAPPGLSASQLKGVIQECKCTVAARTHATIAALSAGRPTVAIAYSRKAKGVLRDFYEEPLLDEVVVPAKEISSTRLSEAVETALMSPIRDEAITRVMELASRNIWALSEHFAG